jgi:ABC-type transport system substrate-binding protein
VVAPPSGVDPRTAKDTATHTLLRQIFEPPFVVRGGAAVPLLFEALVKEPSTDSKRPVLSTRVAKGIVFSDGTPLTAELAARSLSATKAVTDKAEVRHDGDRILFALREPDPRFDLVLTSTYCCIVLQKGEELLGTGAFMFERPTTARLLAGSQEVKLARNPHFRRTPAMNAVTFVVYPPDADGTPTRLLEGCAKGEVDFTAALTSLHVAKIPVGVVYPSIQNGVSTALLSFNTASPALRDKRVRRALAVALDKTAVAKRSFERNPLAFVAKDILPPALDPGEVELFPHNASEATRIFAQTDVVKPQTLKLVIPWAPRPYAPNPSLIGEEIARQHALLGITTEVVTLRSSDDYYSALASGRYDIVFSGWIPDSPDPADTYESLLSSRMVPRAGGQNASANNLSRIESASIDAALSAFRAAPGDATKKALREAIQDEVPLVPVLKGQAVVVLSRTVKNFQHSLDGVYALEELTITRGL